MMITNFEHLTAEMSDDEKKLVPILIKGFYTKRKNNPVKAGDIVNAINTRRSEYNLKNKFTEVRLRKICNFIRSEGILPLIATSSGYYLSYDPAEIQAQIDSLYERADAIKHSADGLKIFLVGSN